MKDKIITCTQCGNSFLFSVEEQERISSLGFDEPRRCTECRKKKAKGQVTNEVWKERGKKRRGYRKNRDDMRGKIRGSKKRQVFEDDDWEE